MVPADVVVPQWTPTEWTLVLGAIGAFIGSIVASLKVLAEVSEIRTRVHSGEKARKEADKTVAAVASQLVPDGGRSLRDSLDRVEQTSAASVRRIDEVAADVRGLRKDVGRLAEQDIADRDAAATAHDQIHRRIDRLDRIADRDD